MSIENYHFGEPPELYPNLLFLLRSSPANMTAARTSTINPRVSLKCLDQQLGTTNKWHTWQLNTLYQRALMGTTSIHEKFSGKPCLICFHRVYKIYILGFVFKNPPKQVPWRIPVNQHLYISVSSTCASAVVFSSASFCLFATLASSAARFFSASVSTS